MDFNQSQHHDDHMEWVPSLPEFHVGQFLSQIWMRFSKPTTIPQKLIDSVDWSMYFDDTGPEGVRGDASTCEEAKAQSSDDLKIATYAARLFSCSAGNADTPIRWKLSTEAVERMLAEYSAEPSKYAIALIPIIRLTIYSVIEALPYR
jgi:hypothetical protein